jgi:transcriptional regulator of acetoin/glycerol metabolism
VSAESVPSRTLSRLKWAEADALQAALRRNKHDMKRTARDLKVSRTTLWRKMKRYGIETNRT